VFRFESGGCEAIVGIVNLVELSLLLVGFVVTVSKGVTGKHDPKNDEAVKETGVSAVWGPISNGTSFVIMFSMVTPVLIKLWMTKSLIMDECNIPARSLAH
jgi:hypothetical protein